MWLLIVVWFLFQAEDGIRVRVRSRGLGDVYKRQGWYERRGAFVYGGERHQAECKSAGHARWQPDVSACLLYTSGAADEGSSVDPGGCRLLKKKKTQGADRVRAYVDKHDKYSTD